ncbi:MAG: tRNA (adenosine(37)-N6)-threonylcarbamoyltransferase complex ATPase subunit type 1 TsaE [Desulfovibrionaceae bacterium]
MENNRQKIRDEFRLADGEATMLAGRLLAERLPETGPYPAIMLRGELGAGKTTFVRGLAGALPGGAEAEVSSPSFNIVNYYPTQPEMAHFDLYRLEHAAPEDELLESLECENRLTVVEWVQYLHAQHWPEDHVEIELKRNGSGRALAVTLSRPSELAGKLLEALDRCFKRF